jgi:hypothetical protein
MASLLTVMTLGILPAVWLSGYALLGCFSGGVRLPLARSVVFCLAPAVSLPLWSVAMTMSAMFGLFQAPLWGAIGWIACIPLVPLIWRRPRLGRRPRVGQDLTFGLVLAAAFAMYAAFPHDSFFVGRDQATYANQALHIARTGELKLRMPARLHDEALRESVSGGYSDILLPVYTPTMGS